MYEISHGVWSAFSRVRGTERFRRRLFGAVSDFALVPLFPQGPLMTLAICGGLGVPGGCLSCGGFMRGQCRRKVDFSGVANGGEGGRQHDEG